MPNVRVAARRLRAAALAAAVLAAFPAGLAAQKHAVTDRSLSTSLLAAAVPFPSAMPFARPDPEETRERMRLELGYSRLAAGGVALPLLIVGARADFQHPLPRRSVSVVGVRAGFDLENQMSGGRVPTAIEVHTGVRVAAAAAGEGTSAGLDLAVGWSNLLERTNGSLGLRAPVEYSRASSWGRLTVAAVPTMAWGHIRFRQCENRGPGDGCGDLEVQLEFGRTRFLIGGGASLGLNGTGLAFSVGTQQLLATGQDPRLAVGLTWAP